MRGFVAGSLGLLASASAIFGADPSPDAEKESPHRWWQGPSRSPDQNREAEARRRHDSDRAMPEAIRERLQSVSPEQRAKFLENWQKWRSLDDQERQKIRQRVVAERFAVDKALDEMIEKSGLELDRDQRELFALRLRQERRKSEEKIRDAIKTLRAELDEEILARLKAEFESRPSAQEE